MATVKFIDPAKTKGANGKLQYDLNNRADFSNVPNVPGVYIVGVKIEVKGQGEKFCPLYVGIRNNLQNRMREHQGNCISGGYLNTVKDLFDIKQPIDHVYSDIEIFNMTQKKKSPYHKNNLKAFELIL